jgi:hypothetical protein
MFTLRAGNKSFLPRFFHITRPFVVVPQGIRQASFSGQCGIFAEAVKMDWTGFCVAFSDKLPVATHALKTKTAKDLDRYPFPHAVRE